MSLTEELKNDLTRSADKKEQLVKSYELWINKREEARWAVDGARETENEHT